ncbi:hypothetical protein FOXYSP1_19031 [Fusarium oxysporum f. sp. phaseoli]
MAIQTINISSDLDQIQEVDSYDEKSFYKQHKGSCTDSKEPAGADDYPADKYRGFNFSPFIVQPCHYYIRYLPLSRLKKKNSL